AGNQLRMDATEGFMGHRQQPRRPARPRPQTAQPIWRSNEAPQDPANLTETTWAGQPALVEAAQQSLRIWPIPDESTNEPVDPTTIELSSSAEVNYSGEAPLIYLGDYVALADDDSGQLRETPIP